MSCASSYSKSKELKCVLVYVLFVFLFCRFSNLMATKKKVFISTDSRFEDILNFFNTHRRSKNISLIFHQNITLERIVSVSQSNEWMREYDFARTCHVALRRMMSKITGILNYHDPPSSAQKVNFNWNISEKNGNFKELAGDKDEAKYIIGEFDRMFPHLVIRNNLPNPGDTRTAFYSNLMFIFEDSKSYIWHIAVNWSVKRPDKTKYDALNPHASLFIYESREIPCMLLFQDSADRRREEAYQAHIQDLERDINNLNIKVL